MSSSNYCFLTHIEVSQDTNKVVWYSHLFKNFSEFFVIHFFLRDNINYNVFHCKYRKQSSCQVDQYVAIIGFAAENI